MGSKATAHTVKPDIPKLSVSPFHCFVFILLLQKRIKQGQAEKHLMHQTQVDKASAMNTNKIS
jgi:hypothetical protein